MAIVPLNITDFRTLFAPTFDNLTTYPDALISLWWDNATAYISDRVSWCNFMTTKQQTLALNYMTAHLLALRNIILAGQQTGIETSATVDKISVTVEPPPQVNQWQYWLNSTPYGQELLALLQVATVGGAYYNGYPISHSFRR